MSAMFGSSGSVTLRAGAARIAQTVAWDRYVLLYSMPARARPAPQTTRRIAAMVHRNARAVARYGPTCEKTYGCRIEVVWAALLTVRGCRFARAGGRGARCHPVVNG